ncbi:hypothetical protein SODG_005004 [Sodalis praecaptivus]
MQRVSTVIAHPLAIGLRPEQAVQRYRFARQSLFLLFIQPQTL